jgi:hypothetical protein
MSAFLVELAHIDVLVRAGLSTVLPYDTTLQWLDDVGDRQELTPATAGRTGAMLIAANMASVNYRYTRDDVEPVYLHTDRPFRPDPVVVLKAIACFEYQSCEPPGWHDSEASSFCVNLRARMIHRLPGYDDAPWVITDLAQARAR